MLKKIPIAPMKVFDFLAMGFCLGLAVNLTIIFFLAVLNGGEVTVTVNTFGEKWVEIFLFPMWVIMGLITFIRMGYKLKR